MEAPGSFIDRRDAGRQLAKRLALFAGRPDVIVLALPRGGVPVAAEIAAALRVPLDVFVVRKLGVPFYEEFAMGAIADGGIVAVNHAVVDALGISSAAFGEVVKRERAELERRQHAYRDDRPAVELRGKTVIVVDDGVATGASIITALAAIRSRDPARIIVAVPVCSDDGYDALRASADAVICLSVPSDFQSVGEHYNDFSQVDDATVRRLLAPALASASR